MKGVSANFDQKYTKSKIFFFLQSFAPHNLWLAHTQKMFFNAIRGMSNLYFDHFESGGEGGGYETPGGKGGRPHTLSPEGKGGFMKHPEGKGDGLTL